MDNEALLKWAQDKNIKQRTIDYFWQAFHNYRLDCPDEYQEFFGEDIDQAKLHYRSLAQQVTFWDCYDESNENWHFVEAGIELEYLDCLDYVTYFAQFDFDGNITDDFFILNSKDKYNRRDFNRLKLELHNVLVAKGFQSMEATEFINTSFRRAFGHDKKVITSN